MRSPEVRPHVSAALLGALHLLCSSLLEAPYLCSFQKTILQVKQQQLMHWCRSKFGAASDSLLRPAGASGGAVPGCRSGSAAQPHSAAAHRG